MVTLVAIRDGFYGGARIRKGASFAFDDEASKPPKWAKPANEAARVIAEEASKLVGGETKPAAAVKAAVKRSGAAITE